MAKKSNGANGSNKRLVKKKTVKKVKRIAPWAAAFAALGGVVTAIADRTLRSKVKDLAAETVAKVRPESSKTADGIGARTAPQSGAV